jgi:hypothetical protein
MPRVALVPTDITRDGVLPTTPTVGDPVNQHVVGNDGSMFLLVRNSGATVARTVSIRPVGKVDGQAVLPRTYVLAIGVSRYIGPFPASDYSDAVQVDVDSAELTLAAYNI